MKRPKFFHWILAVLLSLLTSYVPRKVFVILAGTEGCGHGCWLVAGGWPVAYLVDGLGSSPTGSVSIVSGLLGGDEIRWLAWFATIAFWLMIILLIEAWQRRRPPS